MPADQAMTLQGTVNKTGFMLLIVVLSASLTWRGFDPEAPGQIMPWVIGGFICGLVFAVITIFKPPWAPVTAPFYAAFEGLFLGGVSVWVESFYPGIVMQAVALTFGILFALLFAYSTGVIKATENFKLGIAAATGGIFLVYMLSFVLGFFGVGIPYIHGSGLMGIGFSLFVCVIAALNLVLDFDFIEHGAEHGAPKYMEWYGAFGLMVTLVWLYLEILHLLIKLQSRR
ncbi:Bax inhibitor-1/YccA family protein [Candidatus Sumerlaeota bacterium]|nr:Bax inhibitor-1/YccA family protein [Candidatus Sumerlaeota bacterium]